jgi:hypothetical protein
LELGNEDGTYSFPLPYFIQRLAHLIIDGNLSSFKQANLKKYQRGAGGHPLPRTPAQRLECHHLLDAVRVEVLESQPVLEEHRADEPPGRDGEATLVERHKRDDVAQRRMRHELILWHPPLLGIGGH